MPSEQSPLEIILSTPLPFGRCRLPKEPCAHLPFLLLGLSWSLALPTNTSTGPPPMFRSREGGCSEFPTRGLKELKLPTGHLQDLLPPPKGMLKTDLSPSPAAQQAQGLPCPLINATQSHLLPPGLFKSQMGMYSGLNNIMICKNHS